MPHAVSFVEAFPLPRYQVIASRALRLRELGLSFAAVGRHLAVTGKTARKAIAWAEHNPP
jgi:hypothetical protein